MKKLLVLLPFLFAGTLFAQDTMKEEKAISTEKVSAKNKKKSSKDSKTLNKSAKKGSAQKDVKNNNAKGTLVNLLDEAVTEPKVNEQAKKPE